MIHLKRSRLFAINVAIIFAFQLFAMTSQSIAEEKQTIRLGSARLGSSGYIQFEAISYLINQYSKMYKASSISTAGGTENIALLGEHKIDFGSGDSLGVVYSWKEKNIPVWQVSSWAYWSVPMIVLADSGINSIEDLRGKPVSLINRGSGAELGWSILLEEYGVLNDIKKQYLSWADSYDAVADGIIAAAPGNFAVGKANPALQRLGFRRDYKVLNIDLEVLRRAQKRNPGLLVTTLPRTAYERFEEDITTVGWSGIIMSTAIVDDEMVYELCKAMYEHIDELHKLSAVADATTQENAVKWLLSDYPVHPGAARYYKEIGVWNENLEIGKR